MSILKIVTSVVKTNTYIVYEDNSADALIIDAGGNYDSIIDLLQENNLVPKYVLLTHAHFDHIGAVNWLKEKNGVKVLMSAKENECYRSGELHSKNFPFMNSIPKFTPDIIVEDGQTLELCGMSFRVIATPGHTKGGVCYVYKDNIFTGDTLFYMDIGRTDLAGGNEQQLVSSIRNKLFTLEGDYKILPGHGSESTLSYEKKNNPYV